MGDNMRIRGFSLSMLLAFAGLVASARQPELLSPEKFIQQVKQFHPVAKQADLVVAGAEVDLLGAKGAFDPVFEWDIHSKTLDGTNYYRYSNPALKLPTPFGVGLKTGIESSEGQYRNPELTKGVASYMGIEVPVLRGLLIDKKRAVLRQAEIYRQQSAQERQAMINDLLFDAYASYWNWAAAYQLYSVYTKYVETAEQRRRLVNIAFANGDRAAADTTEAFAQLQSYRLLQAETLRQLNAVLLNVSLYLWTADGEAYLLPPQYRPDTARLAALASLPDTNSLMEQIQIQHPLLRTARYKIQSLEVERRLKFQNLLPELNVQANLLSKDYYAYKGLSSYYLENNYKFGLSIRTPLFLRQARAGYKGIKLKLNDAGLELARKNWEVQTKVRQYYNEALQLREQVNIARGMYQSYYSLVKTEELKFSQGESSLFLINSRENKVLEVEQKLIELQSKYVKAVYSIQWAAATLQ